MVLEKIPMVDSFRKLGRVRSDGRANVAIEEQFEEAVNSGPPDDLLTMVDTTDWIDTKLKALRAHRSQIPEDWFMLSVDEDMRDEVVGLEAFYRVHSSVDVEDNGDLFAGL